MICYHQISFSALKKKGDYKEDIWTSAKSYQYDMDNSFYWDSTGRLFRNYSNWAAGQPDGGSLIESPQYLCMVLNYTDGFQWHDVDCKFDYLRYICEQTGTKN